MQRDLNLSAAMWCKSTYSNSNGGACLEVARAFPGAATWRKSSHSNSNGGSCLEVADGVSGIVPVRDSKDVTRPPLVFPAAAWATFVAGLKDGAARTR